MRHHIFHASGSVEGHWIRIPPPHKTSFDASDTYDMKEDESLFALSGIVSFQERGRGYKLDTAARHGSINCIRVHDIMEHVRQDEIEDLSLSPPAVGSMQIAGSNGFVHNIEFMSQAYLRNRSSKINIEVEDDTSIADKDQPLPIFLKVKISQASSNNPVKAVVSKVASQFHHDNYKQILKVRRRKGEILALMGPSGSGKTTLLKILGGRLQENVRGTVTYNDIPYNTAINRRWNDPSNLGIGNQDTLFCRINLQIIIFKPRLRSRFPVDFISGDRGRRTLHKMRFDSKRNL
ncbi:hypothetical protein T459_25429 [Capsicum annuum]|uniref:ABC transporter domain-containing protein n=1 Tax=Capsicum annuum TaxID=4072 RepID=A0A2G2YKV2_CAPAN|nr:hypothetical protein T459_25429 [Capsicum annuum]